MKKIVWIILIIIIIAGAYFVLTNNLSGEDEIQTVNYVQNGVTFTYPSDWGVSQSKSNYTVAAISLVDSVDSNRIGQVNIHVEKHNFTGDFDDFVNKTYTSLNADSDYNVTSYGDIIIKGQNHTQVTFNSNINGTTKMHKSVWFEHGNDAYVVTYSAPPSVYDQYDKIFEYVISTFKITG